MTNGKLAGADIEVCKYLLYKLVLEVHTFAQIIMKLGNYD